MAGMDAANVNSVIFKTGTTNTTTTNMTTTIDKSEKSNKVEVSSQQIAGKNISQISENEMNELPISERVAIKAIEEANKKISLANRRFEYSIHEKTKAVSIKVIDTDTNEIIKEIPPEKILDIVAKMWELAGGLIVDERR